MTKYSGMDADPSGIASALGSIDIAAASIGEDHSARGQSTNAADQTTNAPDQPADNTDHLVSIADFLSSEDSTNTHGDDSHHSVVQSDLTVASDDGHLSEQQDVLSSSVADVTDQGISKVAVTESNVTFSDAFHFSGLFDLIDNQGPAQADNFNTGIVDSSIDTAVNTSSGPAFSAPEPTGVPDVVSDARVSGGSGGGSNIGTTTPAAYTTNSGTGVNIHVTYDSSVGSAPAAFTADVQKVADFLASSLQDASPITINIDVGFGEVDGMRMGRGALGESATNLQQMSYSQLTSAYSTTGLSLGGSVPSGNLYVSDAEAKAFNVLATNAPTIDGYVGFSSKSGIFDYNNSDGVSTNQYDFYGTVAHEFSEVFGRILLVGANINNAPSYMAYDFFHYSSPGVQDFAGNGGYFSNDQGTTNLASFNNPSNGGDAGDWAKGGTSTSGGSAYDAFNAFASPGEVAPVTHTDLLALQALGFQLHTTLV